MKAARQEGGGGAPLPSWELRQEGRAQDASPPRGRRQSRGGWAKFLLFTPIKRSPKLRFISAG